MKRVTAAQAKAHLSALVAEVAHGGGPVIIERRGKPQAAIVGLGDLPPLAGEEPAAPAAHWALALVGALSDVPAAEIDALVAEIYRQRQAERGRPVELGA